ncbi:MAG: hypothetical protein PHW13_02855 [Methylococcales bacterium]|nr:hypothetical protein [Methylococcales bacterium]
MDILNENMNYTDKNVSRINAFNNIKGAIEFDVFLPDCPFKDAWNSFRFFPSDHIFDSEFVGVINKLLKIENANLCCLLNINQTQISEYEFIKAIYLEESVSEQHYQMLLRGDSPSNGWIYMMDTYACSSDVGDWCIYCDKENDLAVIGFRKSCDSLKFNLPLEELYARPIEILLADKDTALFPFNRLTTDWQKKLLKNFDKI